jgi:hypothetical protein
MHPDEAVAKVAAEQYALFTTAQASAAGMSPTMLAHRRRRGTVVRLEPRLYRLAGAPITWHQQVLAACLAENGLASHRTAAALWQFDGCRPGVVEVLTERWRRRPNQSVRVHETRLLHPDDRDEVDGIPVTSRARTLVDLGAVLPIGRLETALDGALTQKQVTPEEVWECVERLDVPGRPWVAVIRRLVAVRLGTDGPRPNTFERMLFRCLDRAGVGRPEPQVEVRDENGMLIGRVDWLLAPSLVLECDSERWHGGWRRRQADLRRDRLLVGLGYTVLRFSWEDVTRYPEQVATDVRAALAHSSA